MKTEQEVRDYAKRFVADIETEQEVEYAIRQDWIPVPTEFFPIFQEAAFEAFHAKP
jgi:hypothetical protein